jgi:hypothetical protein
MRTSGPSGGEVRTVSSALAVFRGSGICLGATARGASRVRRMHLVIALSCKRTKLFSREGIQYIMAGLQRFSEHRNGQASDAFVLQP